MSTQIIEELYNISYPEIYKKLEQNGMLNWGETCSDWSSVVFPKLQENPPLCLYGIDFEMIDFERISEEIEYFKSPDNYRILNPEFNFVPFGKTGGGDLYCFQFDKEENGNIPIILVYHDEDEAEVLAKNLQDFIFRSMLETLIEFDKDYSLLSYKGKIYENLENYQKTHLPYLSENQKEIISRIYGEIIAQKPTDNLELSEEQRKAIQTEMKNEIEFEDLDTSFECFSEE